MKVYAVYTTTKDGLERNYISQYYHHCEKRVQELNEAGKNCILLGGQQDIFKPLLKNTSKASLEIHFNAN